MSALLIVTSVWNSTPSRHPQGTGSGAERFVGVLVLVQIQSSRVPLHSASGTSCEFRVLQEAWHFACLLHPEAPPSTPLMNTLGIHPSQAHSGQSLVNGRPLFCSTRSPLIHS